MTKQGVRKSTGTCDTCGKSKLPVFKSWLSPRYWIWECEQCLEEKEDDDGYVIQIR